MHLLLRLQHLYLLHIHPALAARVRRYSPIIMPRKRDTLIQPTALGSALRLLLQYPRKLRREVLIRSLHQWNLCRTQGEHTLLPRRPALLQAQPIHLLKRQGNRHQ
jgi:hypothetical protein